MKKLNIAGAVIVLGCAVWASFAHTLSLLQSGGVVEGLEWVVAVMVEVTFLMAAANFVTATLQKRPIRWPIKMGGAIGLGMVGWSNILAGWEYGWTGGIIGVVIPLSLYSAKSILSDSILSPESTNHQSTDQPTSEQPLVEEKPPTIQPTTKTNQPPTPPAIEEKPTTTNQPLAEPTNDQPPIEEEPTTPYEWAVYLHKVEGEPPGRKRVMDAAGCTDWAARTAIKQLKQEIGA